MRTDIRQLKTGQYRLRWRLTENSLSIINHAFSLTGYTNKSTALEAVCMNYISTGVLGHQKCRKTIGTTRLLIKLFPDQFEIVREALNFASDKFQCDADALVNICQGFIEHSEG